ncbi:hypothetical protein H4R20_000527 [Coemansia guatemalensis]|uniref:AAA-ATPase-like domain-containing protein n=1 Tax=Coemansia guatemalensis TaxID=2761395 RepID=A0A9W8LVS2_9FUNG|nr:hypothetical protein H4R20_000527 [Coemansia guatemalensis]
MPKANRGKRTRSRRGLDSYREPTSSQPSYLSGETSGSEYCPSPSQSRNEGPSRQRRRTDLSSAPTHSRDNPELAGQAAELSVSSESINPIEETHAGAFPIGVLYTTPPHNQELEERMLSRVQRSPSKVTGNKYSIGGDFRDIKGSNAITVDKTLLCKAFHDLGSQVTALYLPRRFGKTFGLSIIQSFFSVPLIKDAPVLDSGMIDSNAARQKRLELFSDSSLLENEPDFFNEHFCKYPVIRINFQSVSGASEMDFYKSLTMCVTNAAEVWPDTLLANKNSTAALRRIDGLQRLIEDYSDSAFEKSDNLDICSRASIVLMNNLLNTLGSVCKEKVIVLIDECDLPYITAMHQEWSDNAHIAYTKLLTRIFKNNPYLYKGFMVGIHLVDLCGADSGLNNIAHVSLVAEPPLDGSFASSSEFLSEYFGYMPEEVSILANKAMQSSSGVNALGKACILNKAKEWYDGYAIGGMPGRYNPFGTSHFFNKLRAAKSVDMAAQPYWGKSARPSVIYKLAVHNYVVMGSLASRLMHEFDTGCQHPSIVVYRGILPETNVMREQEFSSTDNSSGPHARLYIQLTSSSYPNTGRSTVSMEQLVTCLLFSGYLTMDTKGGVRIPNGELRRQWEELRLASVFQSADRDEQVNARTAIVDRLRIGDIGCLCDHFKDILQHLSNDSPNYSEMQSADLFRVHVLGRLFASRLVQHAPFTDQPSLPVLTDSEGHSGSGRYDWKLFIPGTSGTTHADGIHVLIEFKRLDGRDATSRERQLMYARRGLEQIVTKGYATRLTSGSMRLDIGIAIGQRSFCARQRLWERRSNNAVSVDRPDNVDWSGYEELSDLTVAQWDKQLADADDQGWCDGLGWKTKAIDSQYRESF